ncbi:MAG: hypothetical protein NZ888_07185 [Candidatus Nitrosocaldus sp.]|nr:hypothetical protein [Candidatus Nitrosocaldus sp.]MDW8000411.1 hypothetical protein [Candidatus Nitrosocaldus sp.]
MSGGRRGVASIVGNLFTIIILLASFTAVFAFIKYQQTAMEVQRALSSIDFSIVSELAECSDGVNYCITVGIINRSERINILSLWITDRYGNVLLQRDNNMTVESGRSTILLDSHRLNLDAGDRVKIKVVLLDGTIRVEEMDVQYYPLEVKALPIMGVAGCKSPMLLINVSNRGETPLTDVILYIDHINGQTRIDVGRLEGRVDRMIQWDAIGIGDMSVYAEGINALDRTVISNREKVSLLC